MTSQTGRIPVGNTVLGVVLLIPCPGHFICPLAVAGLALRYLLINFSLSLGHPFRKPRLTALRSVEIFGLHNDWCENLTAFALVLTECVKLATCEAPSCASNGNVVLFFGGGQTPCDDYDALVGLTMDFVACSISELMGRVHRSVDGSLFPLKITFSVVPHIAFRFSKYHFAPSVA